MIYIDFIFPLQTVFPAWKEVGKLKRKIFEEKIIRSKSNFFKNSKSVQCLLHIGPSGTPGAAGMGWGIDAAQKL